MVEITKLETLTARVAELESVLWEAIERLDDMLKGDDGQAWSEAERAMPKLRKAVDGARMVEMTELEKLKAAYNAAWASAFATLSPEQATGGSWAKHIATHPTLRDAREALAALAARDAALAAQTKEQDR